jgi:hypothetical protein
MYVTIRADKAGRFELFQPDLLEEVQIMAETARIAGGASETRPRVSRLAWLLTTIRAAATLH